MKLVQKQARIQIVENDALKQKYNSQIETYRGHIFDTNAYNAAKARRRSGQLIPSWTGHDGTVHPRGTHAIFGVGRGNRNDFTIVTSQDATYTGYATNLAGYGTAQPAGDNTIRHFNTRIGSSRQHLALYLAHPGAKINLSRYRQWQDNFASNSGALDSLVGIYQAQVRSEEAQRARNLQNAQLEAVGQRRDFNAIFYGTGATQSRIGYLETLTAFTPDQRVEYEGLLRSSVVGRFKADKQLAISDFSAEAHNINQLFSGIPQYVYGRPNQRTSIIHSHTDAVSGVTTILNVPIHPGGPPTIVAPVTNKIFIHPTPVPLRTDIEYTAPTTPLERTSQTFESPKIPDASPLGIPTQTNALKPPTRTYTQPPPVVINLPPTTTPVPIQWVTGSQPLNPDGTRSDFNKKTQALKPDGTLNSLTPQTLSYIETQLKNANKFQAEVKAKTIAAFDVLRDRGTVLVPRDISTSDYLGSRLKQATPRYNLFYDGTHVRRKISNSPEQQYAATLEMLEGLGYPIAGSSVTNQFLSLQRSVDHDLSFAKKLGYTFDQDAKELINYGVILTPEQREENQQLARGSFTLDTLNKFESGFKGTATPQFSILEGVLEDEGIDLTAPVIVLQDNKQVTITANELAKSLHESSFNPQRRLDFKNIYSTLERFGPHLPGATLTDKNNIITTINPFTGNVLKQPEYYDPRTKKNNLQEGSKLSLSLGATFQSFTPEESVIGPVGSLEYQFRQKEIEALRESFVPATLYHSYTNILRHPDDVATDIKLRIENLISPRPGLDLRILQQTSEKYKHAVYFNPPQNDILEIANTIGEEAVDLTSLHSGLGNILTYPQDSLKETQLRIDDLWSPQPGLDARLLAQTSEEYQQAAYYDSLIFQKTKEDLGIVPTLLTTSAKNFNLEEGTYLTTTGRGTTADILSGATSAALFLSPSRVGKISNIPKVFKAVLNAAKPVSPAFPRIVTAPARLKPLTTWAKDFFAPPTIVTKLSPIKYISAVSSPRGKILPALITLGYGKSKIPLLTLAGKNTSRGFNVSKEITTERLLRVGTELEGRGGAGAGTELAALGDFYSVMLTTDKSLDALVKSGVYTAQQAEYLGATRQILKDSLDLPQKTLRDTLGSQPVGPLNAKEWEVTNKWIIDTGTNPGGSIVNIPTTKLSHVTVAGDLDIHTTAKGYPKNLKDANKLAVQLNAIKFNDNRIFRVVTNLKDADLVKPKQLTDNLVSKYKGLYPILKKAFGSSDDVYERPLTAVKMEVGTIKYNPETKKWFTVYEKFLEYIDPVPKVGEGGVLTNKVFGMSLPNTKIKVGKLKLGSNEQRQIGRYGASITSFHVKKGVLRIGPATQTTRPGGTRRAKDWAKEYAFAITKSDQARNDAQRQRLLTNAEIIKKYAKEDGFDVDKYLKDNKYDLDSLEFNLANDASTNLLDRYAKFALNSTPQYPSLLTTTPSSSGLGSVLVHKQSSPEPIIPPRPILKKLPSPSSPIIPAIVKKIALSSSTRSIPKKLTPSSKYTSASKLAKKSTSSSSSILSKSSSSSILPKPISPSSPAYKSTSDEYQPSYSARPFPSSNSSVPITPSPSTVISPASSVVTPPSPSPAKILSPTYSIRSIPKPSTSKSVLSSSYAITHSLKTHTLKTGLKPPIEVKDIIQTPPAGIFPKIDNANKDKQFKTSTKKPVDFLHNVPLDRVVGIFKGKDTIYGIKNVEKELKRRKKKHPRFPKKASPETSLRGEVINKEPILDKRTRDKPASLKSARKNTLTFQAREKFTQRKNAYSPPKKPTKKSKKDEDKYGVPKKPSKKNYFGF